VKRLHITNIYFSEMLPENNMIRRRSDIENH
jgi:hypothetical protein